MPQATKIALELKKYLVDTNKLDITQFELDNALFGVIRSKGLGTNYIDCYRMVTQFFQTRQPLVIVLCGTAWTGARSCLTSSLCRNVIKSRPEIAAYEAAAYAAAMMD